MVSIEVFTHYATIACLHQFKYLKFGVGGAKNKYTHYTPIMDLLNSMTLALKNKTHFTFFFSANIGAV